MSDIRDVFDSTNSGPANQRQLDFSLSGEPRTGITAPILASYGSVVREGISKIPIDAYRMGNGCSTSSCLLVRGWRRGSHCLHAVSTKVRLHDGSNVLFKKIPGFCGVSGSRASGMLYTWDDGQPRTCLQATYSHRTHQANSPLSKSISTVLYLNKASSLHGRLKFNA